MGNLLVVLDSNVIVSSLLHSPGTSSRIIELWRKQYFRVLISNYILSEVKDVFYDKKLAQKYHLSPTKQSRLLTQLLHTGELLETPTTGHTPTRDSHDNPMIQLALEGRADYLVTGDQDLLVLSKHENIQPLSILTPHDFLNEFMNSDDIMMEYLKEREKT